MSEIIREKTSNHGWDLISPNDEFDLVKVINPIFKEVDKSVNERVTSVNERVKSFSFAIAPGGTLHTMKPNSTAILHLMSGNFPLVLTDGAGWEITVNQFSSCFCSRMGNDVNHATVFQRGANTVHQFSQWRNNFKIVAPSSSTGTVYGVITIIEENI